MENKKTNTLIHLNGLRYGEGHIFLWWENYWRRLLYVDILYIEGSGSYCEFHAIDGSRMTISYRLGLSFSASRRLSPVTLNSITVRNNARLGNRISQGAVCKNAFPLLIISPHSAMGA